ncbi:MAG: rod shape-determining protein MreD [Actinobacteria bacterium]|nr:rod shape-determining protein MreD [Actinomycetota bacterium]MCL5888279.1 rod shape-determining protein MreD [Actinomycetota bacterium]
MSQNAGTVGVLVVAFLLQIAIAPQLGIFGIVPNIVFVLMAAIALLRGSRQGAIIGFTCGLIFDFIGSGPIGVSALSFCVAGAMAGALRHNTFAEGWKLPVVIVAVSSLVAELLYAVTLLLLGEGIAFLPTLTDVVLPTAAYNGAIAVGIFPILAHFLRQDRTVQTFRRIGR